MEKSFVVYILASGRNGTLYTGFTSDLVKRIWEHRGKFVDGFTHEYGVTRLVWYEQHGTAEEAITREKQIKNWKRAWKLELIEKANPYWNDLYDEIIR
jgi:putative endonuclease